MSESIIYANPTAKQLAEEDKVSCIEWKNRNTTTTATIAVVRERQRQVSTA